MRKPELSGRMSKWSIYLRGYDIRYDPRTAIKSQALADFVSSFSPAIQNLADKEILTLKGDKDAEVWQMHIDGASNQRGAGVGLILLSPHGDLIVQAIRCEFKVTNNETEYEALILGMQLALDLGIRNLQVYSDSLLIVNHVNDEYVARDSKMIAYLKVAKELKRKFKDCKLKQVPRDQNVKVDALTTLAATFKPTELANIPIAHVLEPSIQKAEEIDRGELEGQQGVENRAVVLSNTDDQSADLDWSMPYLDWLKDGKLPDDKRVPK
ncbi:uncharacterized protein LOC141647138 [Silene latifolia]|uniref:uncharacterized protein LOC141647138 n=1 Tax=Silene latifolia TaxID=37657 RepID=UPI003D7811A7